MYIFTIFRSVESQSKNPAATNPIFQVSILYIKVYGTATTAAWRTKNNILILQILYINQMSYALR